MDFKTAIKDLVVVSPDLQKRETFPNVAFVWPKIGAFLTNDPKFASPKITTLNGGVRNCEFTIPFSARLQSDADGTHLLATAATTFQGFGRARFSPGAKRFGFDAGDATACCDLRTGATIWSRSFDSESPRLADGARKRSRRARTAFSRNQSNIPPPPSLRR